MDLRVKKTYKNLLDALFLLLQEKSFEDIKVTDLCDKAMVHRTTFYTHFEDKYQLLEFGLRNLKEDLEKKMRENTVTNISEYYLSLADIFLDHISQNQQFYRAILKNNRNSVVIDLVYETVSRDVKDKLSNNHTMYLNTIPVEIIAEFYVGAIFRSGFFWLEHQNTISKEQFIAYIGKMIQYSIPCK